jgi:hypothetical protein
MANRKIADRSADAEGTWYDSLPRSTKLPTVAGALIMAVVLMGFGVWGNMAPIAGAGCLRRFGYRTEQDHPAPRGRRICEIYVREGDTWSRADCSNSMTLRRARSCSGCSAPHQAVGDRCKAAGRDEGRAEIALPPEVAHARPVRPR